jgi:glycosyltransferase involved in cell wall biosynthesis
VVVTMDKKPAHHPFTGSSGNGYMYFDLCARNYSAVTAACMMIGKNDFIKTGGFDEINLKVSSNDVDLCLRVLKSGKRVVYNPNAIIIHHEGAIRNKHQKPVPYLSDDLNLIRKHKSFTDSYYNPNQHNEVFFAPDFNKNNRLHYFEKKGSLYKTVFFTHNLNIEGATMVMFKVAKYLKTTGNFQIEVLSQEEGPVRQWYEKEGMTVSVLDVFSSLTKENYPEFVRWLGDYLVKSKISLVYANTLDTFWAIDASYFAEIPSIWGIHESTDPIDYYKSHPRFKNLVPWTFKTILKSNRNLFVCKSTKHLFEKYNQFGNMDFIYNGIRVKSDHQPDKSNLRKKLILPDKTILTIVGTICERKGQLDFVLAAKNLLKSNDNLHFMIVGKNFNDDYYQRILNEIDEIKDIVILDSQENIMEYFNASDIYVCSSYNESFPLVILEAMSYSLPIVTTPVFGISEQLTDGETALFYNPGEIGQLVNRIKTLLDNKNEAKVIGKRARKAVEVLFQEEDMLCKYEELMKTVVFEDVITNNPQPG